MKSGVLFSHSFFYKFDAKQWRFKQPYPPLGTITAASWIREHGYEVSLFDTNLRDSTNELTEVMQVIKPKYFVVCDDGFNYLTKMCLSTMRQAALRMVKIAKDYGCKIIISSSDATDHPEIYINEGADYVVIGEVELTLLELLNKLNSKDDIRAISDVSGLAYIENNELKKTAARKVMKDLDALPLPAWDLVNIETYSAIWKKHHGYFSLNIATTRGCPFKCNWCAKPIYGNRYNSRSPENVVAEIQLLLEKYQPDHFWMCDDIFGLKPGWVQEFNKLIKLKNLNFKYKIQSRADLLLQEKTIDALVESGLETVWIGAESGSQTILDAMDKGITIDQIEKATALLKSKKVKVAFFLQFGYLGESLNDINATLKMVLKLMPDEIGISVSYPLPGTEYYDKVKGTLKEKQNWTDSDDLAMMFQNTFPPAYYKILHRYIHNRYRIQRGIDQLKNIGNKSRRASKLTLRNLLSMVYNTPLSWIHAYQLEKLSRIHANN